MIDDRKHRQHGRAPGRSGSIVAGPATSAIRPCASTVVMSLESLKATPQDEHQHWGLYGRIQGRRPIDDNDDRKDGLVGGHGQAYSLNLVTRSSFWF